MQKSLSPAEAANVVAECRKVPHVKNALFEYTKHEVRAFLRYVRNAHGLEEGADISFGVLSKVGVRVRGVSFRARTRARVRVRARVRLGRALPLPLPLTF